MTSDIQKASGLIEGFRTTALVATAVRLGIIEALSGGGRTAAELAAELKLHEPALVRVMRGLVLVEIIREHAPGKGGAKRFSLAPVGAAFCAAEGSHLANYAGLSARQYFPAWMKLECALTGGAIPFQAAFGKSAWQFRREHPEEGRLFNDWLHSLTATIAETVAEVLPIPATGIIADIAGGNGRLLSSVLRRFTGCRGILAEQPAALAGAKEHLEACDLTDRCQLEPVDFFTAVPAGCDIYLLKSVLHDWADDDCIRILTSLRQAMIQSSRLLIIERFLPEQTLDDPATVWVDLAMLAVTGGRERTLSEYTGLLDRTALVLERATAAAAGFHIMEVAIR